MSMESTPSLHEGTSEGTEGTSEGRPLFTSLGWGLLAITIASLLLSPIFLVFTPAIPLVIIAIVAISRSRLGRGWLGLLVFAIVVFVVDFWPFLGLFAGQVVVTDTVSG